MDAAAVHVAVRRGTAEKPTARAQGFSDALRGGLTGVITPTLVSEKPRCSVPAWLRSQKEWLRVGVALLIMEAVP